MYPFSTGLPVRVKKQVGHSYVRLTELLNCVAVLFVANETLSAPLFPEDGEQPWRRHVWAREVRAAIARHNETAKGKCRIPPGASAYRTVGARPTEMSPDIAFFST